MMKFWIYVALLVLSLGLLMKFIDNITCFLDKCLVLLRNALPFSRPKYGEIVLREVGNILYQHAGKIASRENELPEYKFYTTLLKKLLYSFSEFGGEIGKVLKSFKKGIRLELNYDSKMEAILKGSYFQFIAITVITWSFVCSTLYMVEINVGRMPLIIMVSLQLMGVCVFRSIYAKVQRRSFLGFPEMFHSMYSVGALSSARVSIGATLKEYHKFKNCKKNFLLADISARLDYSVTRYSNFGCSISHEISDLIDDLWDLKEQALDAFLKKLVGLKFVISVVFYFIPYFIFLFELVSAFNS